MARLVEGASFAGYRLDRLIGRGGMGSVWRATDERLGRNVAIKVLSEELAGDERFRARFLAESRLAASLDHPHVVPVFEAGEADGDLFIAMRYVEGSTLDEIVRSDGPLDPPRAVGLLRGIADALDSAHARGLVHRDVKPGNILVARTDSGDHAYLSDFGLTKRLGSQESLTRTGQVLGSVDYIAPEQIEGGAIDGRADVYSLACVLYAALVGAPPYPRDSEMAVLWAHVQTPPPRPSAGRPSLTPLDAVLERGLAKSPADRFPSARALIAAATDALGQGMTRGFMFADLRGYTAYVKRHGDAAGAALLARYRALVRSVVASHEGAEIRTEGDSFYVVFPSASRAVTAALAISSEAARLNAGESGHAINVGIGVHAGEAAETAEGPVGSAVNLAARVCAQARPGEVLVSDTVRTLVRTSLPVAFAARGRRTLKGLDEPVRLWAASDSGTSAVASRVALGRTFRTARPGLVGSVIAGSAVMLVAAVLALRPAAGGPGSSESPDPSSAGAGGDSGEVAPGLWIAYARRSVDVAGLLDCYGSRPGRSTHASELRLTRDDGSDDRRIAPDSGLFEYEPAARDDGSALAFVGESSEGIAIWELLPDGTALTKLIGDDANPGAFEGWSPQWSSDDQLAWLAPNGELGVADGDGTGRRRMTLWPQKEEGQLPTQAIELTWLPDSRIAVIMASGDDDLAGNSVDVVNSDGTGLAPLEFPGGIRPSQVDWSPDESSIALTIRDGGSARIVIVEGSDVRDLTATSSSGGWIDRDPAWSPDGKRVAFASNRTGTYEIYTIDAAGGDPVRLTTTEPVRASCHPSWVRTAGPLPASSPSPAPDDVLTLHRGWLAAGTYRSARFEPAFQVTVPDAWEAWVDSVDGVWLRTLATSADLDPDIVLGRVTVAYTNGCLDQPRELAPRTSRDLVEWLGAHPLLTVTEPQPVDLGGAPGIAVTVTGGEQPTCIPAPRIFLFEVAESKLFVRPGETVRLIAADVRGTLVVAIPRGDETLFPTIVRPVLDSISFKSG